MTAFQRTTQRLEQALNRASRAKRGNIMRTRFYLEQARTQHLQAEIKQEKKK
jgi:hypothetical protein